MRAERRLGELIRVQQETVGLNRAASDSGRHQRRFAFIASGGMKH